MKINELPSTATGKLNVDSRLCVPPSFNYHSLHMIGADKYIECTRK